MKNKNLYAILMAGIMLATIFSAISVNAANNTPVSTSVGTKTTMDRQVTVICEKLVFPYVVGVPGVRVDVYDTDNNWVASGTTNDWGRVYFDLSKEVSILFTLYFTHTDYKAKPYTLYPLLPGNDVIITIGMQKKSDVSSTPVLPSNLVPRIISTGTDVIAIR